MSTTYRLDITGQGSLTDPSVANLFAQLVKPGDKLDFTGVKDASPAFLEALLGGTPLEELEERLTGVGPEVDAALAAWLDQRQEKAPAIETKPSVSPAPKAPRRQTAAPLTYDRPPLKGARYTPTRLVHRLRESLTRYIESAYPLSEPTLVRARRRLLQEADGGRLLAQEPYIETTTQYQRSDRGYDQLGLPDHVGAFLAKLAQTPQKLSPDDTLLYPGMWAHQAQAFRAFLAEGKDTIVATGTGSGKTECFLIPMLGSLYDEAVTRPKTWTKPGVRALILYPMNALVNDQLSRLRLLLGDPGVDAAFPTTTAHRRAPTFGMYTGRTPYPGPRKDGRDHERVAPLLEYYLNLPDALREELQRRGRYPAKDLAGFYAKGLEGETAYKSGQKVGKSHKVYNWKRRLHTQPGDRELLTRQEMVSGSGSEPGHAPDVLITNYSMLEYMLMRPFERPIFDETADWLRQEGSQFLLVLDEAHMYRGAQGAEVGFLLRRLRARLGINDRPDKLRVICTSASLGSDAAALENIRRFAADLTGKSPDDFAPVTGRRASLSAGAPGGGAVADLLAAIDLNAVHAAADLRDLRAAVAPLLAHLGAGDPEPEEEALLAQLYAVLREQPFVHRLQHQTAGEARSLSALAEALFPGHPRAVEATERLLTLGAIARPKPDSAGLIPTRVHAMFRGLHGLYACCNPSCDGRQDAPGQEAALGKLFAAPQSSCDACGGRVFELASCRSCGSPYLLAYAEHGPLEGLSFLWSETEGPLQQVQVLPSKPRYEQAAEEVWLHLQTGYLDRQHTFQSQSLRPVWIALDADGRREAAYPRCPMCQPASSARARILDFRTRGEQPFTALIESQFSEQPPQKGDRTLSNQGRKVLVFSDGRQKAAKLAPALEHSHARDLFRQVVALAADALAKQGQPGMGQLYPAVVWVCRSRGINLFPAYQDEDGTTNPFHEHLQRAAGKTLAQLIQMSNQGKLRPTKDFARQLFSEMTDRFYSLFALALASVEEDPLSDYLFEEMPDVGLDDAAKRTLLRSWMRLQLEQRRFVPPGADLSQLGEGWDRPEGINLDKPAHVFPHAFRAYLDRVLGDKAAAQALAEWFPAFIRTSGFFEFENDVYFLKPDSLSLRLRLDEGWLRCRDCARLYHEVLEGCCPACQGETVDADQDYLDARTGFYRRQLERAFQEGHLEPFGLVAAEHSAQLTGLQDGDAFNKTEKYELRFQDIAVDGEPPIDVLSCTTTMEVGIDIGALSGVALRNVPPHVANYQQRAGRAGRRGRSVASVITYAHGTSHDAHYYSHPERIISGDVRPPIVYIENQQVLRRHINAYLVQRFFHAAVPANTKTYELFESLGSVGAFLLDEHPCSLPKLEAWLQANRPALQAELAHWAPRFSHGLAQPVADVQQTILTAIDALVAALRRVLPVAEFAQRESIEGTARESLEKRLEDQLLETLIKHAIFPRYAFPTDVVAFWVSRPKQRGDPRNKRSFEYEPQRDLQVALSEYAPGRSLTIDKWRFTSEAIYSPYAPSLEPTLERAQSYTACQICHYVSLKPDAYLLTECPCCRAEKLFKQRFITPPGFAPDINAKRQEDRGQAPTFAGMTTRAQLEVQEPPAAWDALLYGGRLGVSAGPQNLAMVNKGVGDRGFLICPGCGRTEPVFGPGYPRSQMMKGGSPRQHKHPLEQGRMCDGLARGPYYLGHQFLTDVLLLQLQLGAPVTCETGDRPGYSGRPARAALTSLAEGVCLAASRRLQIDEGELAGGWSPVMGGGRQAQLFLYDLLPGGAGYTRMVMQDLDGVLEATEALLAGCDCESSCYRCLRHYGNHPLHSALDRTLALDLLRYVRQGAVPSLTEAQQRASLVGLCELARLKGLDAELFAPREGVQVPLLLRRAGAEVWVDVHHPLLDVREAPSAVEQAADLCFQPAFPADAFSLVHNLPAVSRSLELG